MDRGDRLELTRTMDSAEQGATRDDFAMGSVDLSSTGTAAPILPDVHANDGAPPEAPEAAPTKRLPPRMLSMTSAYEGDYSG